MQNDKQKLNQKYQSVTEDYKAIHWSEVKLPLSMACQINLIMFSDTLKCRYLLSLAQGHSNAAPREFKFTILANRLTTSLLKLNN